MPKQPRCINCALPIGKADAPAVCPRCGLPTAERIPIPDTPLPQRPANRPGHLYQRIAVLSYLGVYADTLAAQGIAIVHEDDTGIWAQQWLPKD